MPLAIYIFSLCTFAFGLSEFVVAGLVSAMAQDLQSPVAAVGTAIAAYALGAAIGAPLITALVSHWRDRHVLALATAALAAGSVLMAWSPTLWMLLLTRFLVGLAHGVFMAVASDAATRLVPSRHAGRALSVVWLGLTLALALGVPLGTFLGSLWSWRGVFMAVGASGLLCTLGLLCCMADQQAAVQAHKGHAWRGLRAMLQPQLLGTAGIGVLVSVATFSFFSFVSPYLLGVTGMGVAQLSLAMLVFGLCTVLGNLLGGYLVDKMDGQRSTVVALAGLAVNLLGLYCFRASPAAMMLLLGALGMCFFGIVTMLTLRLLQQAQRHAPQATAVAAGLNIASFNLGTALGGALGSATIALGGLAQLPLVSALAAAAACLCFMRTRQSTAASMAGR